MTICSCGEKRNLNTHSFFLSANDSSRFRRPPDINMGERACCLGERCICVWMARWRYGDDTDLAFVGTEFLLPSQRAAFERDGASALPPTPGKCLVCSRYMHVRRRLRACSGCARARKQPSTARWG